MKTIFAGWTHGLDRYLDFTGRYHAFISKDGNKTVVLACGAKCYTGYSLPATGPDAAPDNHKCAKCVAAISKLNKN
jgi:hypothetical protein